MSKAKGPKKTAMEVDEVVEKARPLKKKSKKQEDEDSEVHELTVTPKVAKSTAAKKVGKATAAAKSNNKKRKADRDNDSSDEASNDSEVEAAPVAPAGKKSRAVSKNSKASKQEDDDDFAMDVDIDESSEEEKKPKKSRANSASGKKSSAKSTGSKASSSKKAANDDDDSDFAGDDEPVEPKEKKPKRAEASKAKSTNDDDNDVGDGEEVKANVIPHVPTDFNDPPLEKGEIKIVSWNVMSYRAIQKKGFMEYLKSENPDILCIQESKLPSAEKTIEGYQVIFFGYAAKPGHHGTAIFTKVKPLKVETLKDLEEEGRIIVAEFDRFYLFNTYVPNSGMNLDRLPWRINHWDKGFHEILLKYEAKKPVIWCGDLNVAHMPIDLKNPKTNVRFNSV